MPESRVDAVIGDYFRKGKCQVCGLHCERSKKVRAASYAEMQARGAEWAKTPLTHKRCEGLAGRPIEDVELP